METKINSANDDSIKLENFEDIVNENNSKKINFENTFSELS